MQVIKKETKRKRTEDWFVFDRKRWNELCCTVFHLFETIINKELKMTIIKFQSLDFGEEVRAQKTHLSKFFFFLISQHLSWSKCWIPSPLLTRSVTRSSSVTASRNCQHITGNFIIRLTALLTTETANYAIRQRREREKMAVLPRSWYPSIIDLVKVEGNSISRFLK